MKLCRDFMHNRCTHSNCKFVHDPDICFHFWKHGPNGCKFGDQCPKKHLPAAPLGPPGLTKGPQGTRQGPKDKRKRPKNTETFEPMTRPVDMRVVFDLNKDRCTVPLTTRDVVLAPNLFADYAPGELYAKLVAEVEASSQALGLPQDKVLKLWHGDSHLIADDHTQWKRHAPTFRMVLDRIRDYFQMDIQATRFNWYQDTSQWKPMHHDAASFKPEKAKTQNFTVGVSFGATRDAAFEDARTKTVVSFPQPDGCAYCFAKDTNVLWRHGILKEKVTRPVGRISVIAWGWVENQEELK
jgi:hypothetical protein